MYTIPELISEKKLSDIWRQQAWENQVLVTENGTPVTIVYPGRLNNGRGGDFCDAVVNLGSHTITGNIELHTKASDWQAHGHHRDNHYNQVVLHVVYHNNRRSFTTRQDGVKIPVLSLCKAGLPSTNLLPGKTVAARRCRTINYADCQQSISDILKSAGDARFYLKSDRFASLLAYSDTGQVLFQGIMEGLGYSKNQAVFRELAGVLPLVDLQSNAQSAMTDLEYFQQTYYRLLSAAGIRPVGEVAEDKVKTFKAGSVNSPFNWQTFRIRPGNSPVIRLAAMSLLLVRYRHLGLLEGLVHQVKEVPEDKNNRALENSLVVSAKEHLVTLFLPDTPSPLGRSRAVEIIVNILLPYTHAFARSHNDFELSRKAVFLYHRQEKTAGNGLERHMMAQLGLSGKMITHAYCQQGLLHIYQKYCISGRCEACCLSQLEVGNHIKAEVF